MTQGAARMQLLVKTPLGHTIAVDGGECGTVGGLKRHIEEREGILAHEQRIVGRGRALRDDSAALDSVGLGDGAMVEVLLGLRGGAKKGGKKAKINETPEEKMLREATEKLKGEEDRRRKEEAMRQYLTNGLQEEEKFAKLNLAKIQNQWRKLMRLAKVESLRKDLEIMSQNHEREVDMKDAIIQMLDRDLDEAEEQYQMALRSHLQNVDALIDLYNSKVCVRSQRRAHTQGPDAPALWGLFRFEAAGGWGNQRVAGRGFWGPCTPRNHALSTHEAQHPAPLPAPQRHLSRLQPSDISLDLISLVRRKVPRTRD